MANSAPLLIKVIIAKLKPRIKYKGNILATPCSATSGFPKCREANNIVGIMSAAKRLLVSIPIPCVK